MDSPSVSVIIAIRDETDPHIDESLQHLAASDYPGELEVIVVKGGNIAQARNMGIKFANGDIIAFTDSDCLVINGWPAGLVKLLNYSAHIGGVGGPNYSATESHSKIQKEIDFVFSTRLGSLGSSSLFQPKNPSFTEKLACINSVYYKSVLKLVDGFDEQFDLCEDTNLSHKVRLAGWKLLFVPTPYVLHYRRESIKSFFIQFYNYGQGRMRSILTDRVYADKILVGLFASCLFSLSLLVFAPMLGLFIWSSYFALITMISAWGALRLHKIVSLPRIFLLFVAEHVGYTLGMLCGLLKGKWRKKRTTSQTEIYKQFLVRGPGIQRSLEEIK
jgi:GT2 family glycosyltransferase